MPQDLPTFLGVLAVSFIASLLVTLVLTGTPDYRVWLPPVLMYMSAYVVGTLALMLLRVADQGMYGMVVVAAIGAAVWWHQRKEAERRRLRPERIAALEELRDSGVIDPDEHRRRVKPLEAADRRERERWTWRGHGAVYWMSEVLIFVVLAFGLAMCVGAMVMYGKSG